MEKEWTWKGALLGSLVLMGALLLGGCASHTRAVVYVPVGPPVAVRETITVSPGHGYVWVSGHHRWDQGNYVWVPGHWTAAPRNHARWVSGRWQHDRHGWYWVEGHWR